MVATLSEGSRILITNPQGTKSHQNSYIPIVKELVKKGHHFTIITNYVNDELTKFDNVRQIWMETLAMVMDSPVFANSLSTMSLFEKLKKDYEVYIYFSTSPLHVTETVYGDPRIQQMMVTESFDLVIIPEACSVTCYPFGWHFKAPVIAISPNVLFPGRANMLGDSEQLSYVPFMHSAYTDKMNLYERAMNFIRFRNFYHAYHNWHIDAIESIQKIFPARKSFYH